MTEPILPAGSPRNELLTALRLHTVDLHRRLDERISETSILTSEGYLRFLTMHARVLPAVETWLSSRADFVEMPESQERLRTSALNSDFEALGIALPPSRNMSFLNETASVAGICYVLEGSRLGGAYLVRQISRSGSDQPSNFLNHGREKSLWSSFLAWLAARELSPAGIGRATEAAESMFGAYLSALE
ncbi:MAG TPA: biliverdin-producing heme oxygenase [Ensifer sp.]|nr:biliverdin-producing heme oxygenase [Ensifer sp.]